MEIQAGALFKKASLLKDALRCYGLAKDAKGLATVLKKLGRAPKAAELLEAAKNGKPITVDLYDNGPDDAGQPGLFDEQGE
jgi:hypothetical protein